MASVSLALVVLWTQSPALALVLVGPLVAVALHQRATHNALRAMRLALTDPLTGLGNHRHFQEQLQIQLEEAVDGARAAHRLPLRPRRLQADQRPLRPSGRRPRARPRREQAARDRRGLPARRRRVRRRLPAHARRRGRRRGRDGRPRARRGGAGSRAGSLSITAGIATYPDHSNDRNALVRVADIALYWAKGEGKNRVCVYRPDMPAVTQLRRLTRAPDRAARLQAAAALASAVDARDAFEGSHSTRVGDLAAGVAARLRPARGGDRADPPGRPAARHRQARRARGDPAQAGPAQAAREGRAREPPVSRPRDAARRSTSSPCRRGCCTTTSAGTAPASRRSSPASASRSARGSSSPPTPGTR